MTVSELLLASMAEHERAKPRKGKVRDKEAMRRAYELRRKAHRKDPKHEDQAWKDEQLKTPIGSDTHAALMKFYREQGVA